MAEQSTQGLLARLKKLHIQGASNALIFGGILTIPATGLLQRSTTTVLVLLVLLSFYKGWRDGLLRQPSLPENPFSQLALAFVAVSTLMYIERDLFDEGYVYETFKEYGKSWMVIYALPLGYLFARVYITIEALWLGSALGACSSGIYALWLYSTESWEGILAWEELGVVDRGTFGMISLLLAALCLLGGQYYSGKQERFMSALMYVSAVFGAWAVVVAHNAVILLAMPALLGLFVIFYSKRVTVERLVTVCVIYAVAIAALYMLEAMTVPQVTVVHRSGELVSEAGEGAGLQVPSPGEDLSAAETVVVMPRPLPIGSGFSLSETNGERPRSEYQYALKTRGILGLAVFLALLSLPAVGFIHAMRTTDRDLQYLGVAGLVVIIAFSHLGLANKILLWRVPMGFFLFYVTLIMGLVTHRRNARGEKLPLL